MEKNPKMSEGILRNLHFIKILKFRVEVHTLDSRTNLDKSQLDKGQRHLDAGNLLRGSHTKTPTKKGEFPYQEDLRLEDSGG